MLIGLLVTDMIRKLSSITFSTFEICYYTQLRRADQYTYIQMQFFSSELVTGLFGICKELDKTTKIIPVIMCFGRDEGEGGISQSYNNQPPLRSTSASQTSTHIPHSRVRLTFQPRKISANRISFQLRPYKFLCLTETSS